MSLLLNPSEVKKGSVRLATDYIMNLVAREQPIVRKEDTATSQRNSIFNLMHPGNRE
jgi:hypothetical protein